MNNRLVLAWSDIDHACECLVRSVQNQQILGIAGVVRGGLVPATILSYAMGTPLVSAINPRSPQIVQGMPEGRDLLIIDDVCDMGATISTLNAFYRRAIFASLFIKPAGGIRCNYLICPHPPISQDTWIAFPWSPKDYEETLAISRKPHI